MKYSLLFSIVVVFIHPAILLAWSQSSTIAVSSDAKNLMPPNFRWFIEKHENEFRKNLLNIAPQPAMQEIERNLVIASQQIAEAIKKHGDIEASAGKLGAVAGTVIRLIHPLRWNTFDSRISTDYEIYLDKKRSQFFIRWPGMKKRPVLENDLIQMIRGSIDRCKDMSLTLKNAFEHDLKPIEAYDNKSAPFGIGSMAYSEAVTATAMTWLYIWGLSGGIK